MKLLLYCTKAKPYLTRNDLPNEKGEFYKHWQLGGELDKKHLYGDTPILNGKIVAECDFEVEELTLKFDDYEVWIESNTDENVILKQSCLNDVELYNYLGGGNRNRGYAIHIKNLHIFDDPKFIQDYSTNENPYNYIENAPQNMMYAYDVKSFENYEKNILISIRPEWLCKILNGEKTIEVRKKVLRGMLE